MIGHWNSEEDAALQYLPLRAQVIYLRGIRRYADQNGIAGLKRAISWKSLSEVAEFRPAWGSKDPIEAPSRKCIRVSITQLESAGLVEQLPQSERFKGLVFKCLMATRDKSVKKRKGQGRAMIPQCEEGPRENIDSMRLSEKGRAKEGPRENPPETGEEGPASPSPCLSKDKPPSNARARGTRLSEDWSLPADWREWAEKERPDLDIGLVAETFKDHWLSAPGKDGRKADWKATWRNWVRRERRQSSPRGNHENHHAAPRKLSAAERAVEQEREYEQRFCRVYDIAGRRIE